MDIVFKKTVYDKLVIKANVIDNIVPNRSGQVAKTPYDLDKLGLEKKI